jgi:hypothetical protein
MQISNDHTNIQQNKKLSQNLWEELTGQMVYPI